MLRAAAEGDGDRDAEGDLVLEKSGAGDPEVELDSELEAVDLGDLGVEGAAAVLPAAAGCRSSAILFPAML